MLPSLVAILFSIPFVLFFRTFPDPSFINDVVVVSVVLLLFFLSGLKMRDRLYLSPVLVVWLGWGGGLALSITLNEYEIKSIWSGYFFAWLVVGLFVFSFSQFVGKFRYYETLNLLAFSLLASGLIGAFIGGLHFYGVFPGTWWFVPEVSARFSGVFGQPNSSGVFSVITLSALVFLFKKRKISLSFSIPIALILGMVIFSSGSRTAWLAFFCVSIYEFFCWLFQKVKQDSHGRRLVGVIYLCVLAGATIMPFFDQAIYQVLSEESFPDRPLLGEYAETRVSNISGDPRVEIWKNSVEILTESPLFGIGPGRYSQIYFSKNFSEGKNSSSSGFLTHSHNLFLSLGSEYGLLGLIFLFFPLVFIVFRYRDSFFICRPESCFLFSVAGIIFVHSMTEYPLWNLGFLVLTFAVGVLIFPALSIGLKKSFVWPFAASLVAIVGFGLVLNYSTIFIGMASLVNGWSEKDAERDLIFVSSLEDDGYFAHKARFLKYNFFEDHGLYNKYEIMRTEEMLRSYPAPIVVARYSIMAILNDLPKACSWTVSVVEYYPETEKYLEEFWVRYESGKYANSYLECITNG